jgi:ubiquinone/menaquinone biosynthesis C-methylase UbiE
MTSSNFNQKNYNIWSSTYDNSPNATVMIDELKFPALYKNWSGQKILDVGCGTGRHTLRLFNQGNIVIGIDISDGMLSKAKEKLPEVEFIHGDFMEHHFEETRFDKIIMSLVLEHIKDLNSFFYKVETILTNKGEFLISELHPERSKQGSLAHFRTSKGNEIRLSSKHHSEEEILSSAESNGLKLNFKKNIIGNNELTRINKKWSKYLNRPMIQMWSFFK